MGSKLINPKKVLFVPPLLGTKIEIIVAHFGGGEPDREIVRNMLRSIMEEAYMDGSDNKWEIDTAVGIPLCFYCGQRQEVVCMDCDKSLCLRHRNLVFVKEPGKQEKEARVICNDCMPLNIH